MGTFLAEVFADPVGRWFVYIGAVFVMLILVGVGYTRVKGALDRFGGDLGEVKEQVKNSHDTNLREEGDQRHEENAGKLDTMLDMIANLQKSMGRVYDKVDGVEKSVGVLTGRVDVIEDTQDRPVKPTLEKP